MRRIWGAATLGLIIALCGNVSGQQEKKKSDVIWKGEIHLGDTPSAYSKLTSAGMCMQIAFRADSTKKNRLTVTASDVLTRAGDGHYIEIYSHHQGKEIMPPTSTLLETFRIKEDSGDGKDYVFAVSLEKAAKESPTFFSVKISVDSAVPFGLWDDFVVKQIKMEEMK